MTEKCILSTTRIYEFKVNTLPCYLSITHQLCSFVYYETTSNDRRFRSSRYCMLRANIFKKKKMQLADIGENCHF